MASIGCRQECHASGKLQQQDEWSFALLGDVHVDAVETDVTVEGQDVSPHSSVFTSLQSSRLPMESSRRSRLAAIAATAASAVARSAISAMVSPLTPRLSTGCRAAARMRAALPESCSASTGVAGAALNSSAS